MNPLKNHPRKDRLGGKIETQGCVTAALFIGGNANLEHYCSASRPDGVTARLAGVTEPCRSALIEPVKSAVCSDVTFQCPVLSSEIGNWPNYTTRFQLSV